MSQHRSSTRSDGWARAALILAVVAVVAVAGYALWAGVGAMTTDQGSATGMAAGDDEPTDEGGTAASPPPGGLASGGRTGTDDVTSDTGEGDGGEDDEPTGADPSEPSEPHPCAFTDLRGELPPGYEAVQPCPSGATLRITAPDGYGEDPREGGPDNDRNRASAATADPGVEVLIDNPSAAEPFVITPHDQPGCFGQYIAEAGYDWVPMIDAGEMVTFEDDGRPKDFVAHEDCAYNDPAGDGTGDELRIEYRP